MKNVGIRSALAVLLVVGMAGCAAAAPMATPSVAPSATSAPTPSPTPEPVTWPVQLVPGNCDDLLPQATVDAIFGEPLQLGFQRADVAGRDGIWAAAARNSGSLECMWGVDSVTENPEETHTVRVTVIPRAADIAARISSEIGGKVLGEPTGGCDWGYCSSGALLGEYWVDVEVVGTDDPAAISNAGAQTAIDTVMAAVRAMPPSNAPEFPSQSASWPTQCGDFVSEQAISDALNLPGATFTIGYSYRSGNAAYGAIMASGGLVCGIGSDVGGRTGSIVTLPESGELFAAARDVAVLSDEVEAIEVPGLETGSAFVRRSPETPTQASLEMNLHGTWVLVSMGVFTEQEGNPAPRLIRLAEVLAAG